MMLLVFNFVNFLFPKIQFLGFCYQISIKLWKNIELILLLHGLSPSTDHKVLSGMLKIASWKSKIKWNQNIVPRRRRPDSSTAKQKQNLDQQSSSPSPSSPFSRSPWGEMEDPLSSFTVSSPRRTLSLLKRGRRAAAWPLPDQEGKGAGGGSPASPKPSEVYGFVGAISTVIATGKLTTTNQRIGHLLMWCGGEHLL